MAVCPVRRQCPRFQAPGYTEVQSWTRPGSLRISRLGGRANGALHYCTNNHCNPITLEAPQLLHGRTAGSPCRDKNAPVRSSHSSQNLSGRKERDERRKKSKVKGEERCRKPVGDYLPSLSLRLSLKLRLSLYISLMVEQESLIKLTSCSLRFSY